MASSRPGGSSGKIGNKKKGCEAYEKRGQREINRKAKWLRTLKHSKSSRDEEGKRTFYMNRAVALRLHNEHAMKFRRNPVSELRGPYIPN